MTFRLLLDANLSPETAEYLRSLGFSETQCLLEDGLGELEDDEIAALARRERRIIFTFDLDFGEIYYFLASAHFRAVVLRLADQRVESVNAVLTRFLLSQKSLLRRQRFLAIVDETSVRIS